MFIPTIELVHSDSRGQIFVINLPDEKELVLLHSKKGSLRGGHAHDVSEVIVLLTGAMSYSKKMSFAAPSKESVLRGGDVSFNQAGEFHLGGFSEDSWLIEFKINTKKGDWSNIDDPGYRAIVKASI